MGDLADRLARGDGAAFAELYDACADRLHPWLVAVLGSRHDADDVLQETFVRLAQQREKLAGVDNLAAYVFTVARHEAARFAGRRQRERSASQARAEDLFCEAGSDELDEREAAELVAAALARLPDEQREVVHLKAYADLTLAEIAAVTGAPPGTVATRYRAAIAKLKDWLSRKCRD